MQKVANTRDGSSARDRLKNELRRGERTEGYGQGTVRVTNTRRSIVTPDEQARKLEGLPNPEHVRHIKKTPDVGKRSHVKDNDNDNKRLWY